MKWKYFKNRIGGYIAISIGIIILISSAYYIRMGLYMSALGLFGLAIINIYFGKRSIKIMNKIDVVEKKLDESFKN